MRGQSRLESCCHKVQGVISQGTSWPLPASNFSCYSNEPEKNPKGVCDRIRLRPLTRDTSALSPRLCASRGRTRGTCPLLRRSRSSRDSCGHRRGHQGKATEARRSHARSRHERMHWTRRQRPQGPAAPWPSFCTEQPTPSTELFSSPRAEPSPKPPLEANGSLWVLGPSLGRRRAVVTQSSSRGSCTSGGLPKPGPRGGGSWRRTRPGLHSPALVTRGKAYVNIVHQENGERHTSPNEGSPSARPPEKAGLSGSGHRLPGASERRPDTRPTSLLSLSSAQHCPRGAQVSTSRSRMQSPQPRAAADRVRRSLPGTTRFPGWTALGRSWTPQGPVRAA